MKKYAFYLLLILITAVLAACGSTTTAKPTAIPPVEISLTGKDIAYDTNRIEVAAGQPVRLTFHNDGVLEHDFSIIEMPHMGEATAGHVEGMDGHDTSMNQMDVQPELHVAAPMGGMNTLDFTPSEPGEYEFFCTVSGHKEAGMMGTLVVTEP